MSSTRVRLSWINESLVAWHAEALRDARDNGTSVPGMTVMTVAETGLATLYHSAHAQDADVGRVVAAKVVEIVPTIAYGVALELVSDGRDVLAVIVADRDEAMGKIYEVKMSDDVGPVHVHDERFGQKALDGLARKWSGLLG